jgi:hypothetical protein
MANPAPPPGTTAVMILRNAQNGNYEIYDIGNNSLLAAYFLGQVGLDWEPAGGLAGADSQPVGVRLSGINTSLGRFYGNDTSDMMLRNVNSGQLQVYDISNNNITSATALGSILAGSAVSGFGDFNGDAMTDMMVRNTTSGTFVIYNISNNIVVANATLGTVGIDWQFAGFGDFNDDRTSDMMLRNALSGAFQLYDINNDTVTASYSLGTVGIDWLVAGYGNFSSVPGETDMLLRNVLSGAFQVYDISNNQITASFALGNGRHRVAGRRVRPDQRRRPQRHGDAQPHHRRIRGLRHRQQSNHDGRLIGCSRRGLASCRHRPRWGRPGDGASSDNSNAQLVQAMAGFGSGGGAAMNSMPTGTDASQQQQFLATPQHA